MKSIDIIIIIGQPGRSADTGKGFESEQCKLDNDDDILGLLSFQK